MGSKQAPSQLDGKGHNYNLASVTWLTLLGVRNHSPSDDDYYGNNQGKDTCHDQSNVPF